MWQVEYTISRNAELNTIATGNFFAAHDNEVYTARKVMIEGIETWLREENILFGFRYFDRPRKS